MTPPSNPAERPAPVAWHLLPAPEVLALVKSAASGLSVAEAAQRLVQCGPNELREAAPTSPCSIFFRQFASLIVWILIGADLVSGLLREVIDAFAILAIVVLNAAVGFYQEYNAEKSIAALKRLTAPQAKVWRDGKLVAVPASHIVPGDVLELESGDLVAADARLLSAAAFRCIEAALTGESEPVEKEAAPLDARDVPLAERANLVFLGTSVANGSARAVVVATAMETEIGRIATLIDQAGQGEGTPLQQRLKAFGRILVWASLGIVAGLFGIGLLRGTPFLEMFMTSVSLAVAAVPEGLPAIVTIALALGVSRMSRRRALVRRLPSVETLGSTNVICTDKTGTLTVGEMTVRAMHVGGTTYDVSGEGDEPKGEVRLAGVLADAGQMSALRSLGELLVGCNNAHLSEIEGKWQVIGDPTDGAMLSAGIKAGADPGRLESEWPKVGELPFDSDRKRHSVIRQTADGRLRAFINGAPDLLLKRCTQLFTAGGVRPLTETDRTALLAANAALASQALRVLGSAYRDLAPAAKADLPAEDLEQDLVFVGLVGMQDPPRAEAKAAIARCRNAGIRVVMITGDHPQTVLAIARQLGLATATATASDNAATGAELDKLSDEALRARAPEIAVYARVTAEHKLRIVRAWKANDAVVAMTGDGVNDAPAIKGPDIGIAMGRSGTEVTKQASDMIITDDNFATIVAAVEEGRGIDENIRKTLQYLLAGNSGELLLMTVCVAIGLPSPLLPIHLLWINLVTDGLPALCLATDPIDPDVMNRRPRGASGSRTAAF